MNALAEPKQQRQQARQQAPSAWPLWKKALASLLIVVHLAAVFAPPFAFASRGPEAASPVAVALRSWLRPYIDIVFLDHGYAFFAPEPGPSHLLRCRLKFDDGRAEREIVLPDRRAQWPRLLYHRHFMLAEQLHSMFVPGEIPPGDEQMHRVWRAQRRDYEARRNSFAAHLRNRYGASEVELQRVEHLQPSPGDSLRGRPLTDPQLYSVLPETMEDAP